MKLFSVNLNPVVVDHGKATLIKLPQKQGLDIRRTGTLQ
jgi:hypothetical protein